MLLVLLYIHQVWLCLAAVGNAGKTQHSSEISCLDLSLLKMEGEGQNPHSITLC